MTLLLLVSFSLAEGRLAAGSRSWDASPLSLSLYLSLLSAGCESGSLSFCVEKAAAGRTFTAWREGRKARISIRLSQTYFMSWEHDIFGGWQQHGSRTTSGSGTGPAFAHERTVKNRQTFLKTSIRQGRLGRWRGLTQRRHHLSLIHLLSLSFFSCLSSFESCLERVSSQNSVSPCPNFLLSPLSEQAGIRKEKEEDEQMREAFGWWHEAGWGGRLEAGTCQRSRRRNQEEGQEGRVLCATGSM